MAGFKLCLWPTKRQKQWSKLRYGLTGFERFYPKNRPTRGTRGKSDKSGRSHTVLSCTCLLFSLLSRLQTPGTEKESRSKPFFLWTGGQKAEAESKPGSENKPRFNADSKGSSDNTQLGARALQQLLITAGLVAAIAAVSGAGRPEVQEISFQHFKAHLLAKEAIDKLEVTNKTLVKVYVRPGAQR